MSSVYALAASDIDRLRFEEGGVTSDVNTSPQRRWTKVAKVVALATGVLFAGIAVVQIGHLLNHSSNLSLATEVQEKVQVKPDDGPCSYGTEDCSGTQCCNGAGMKCYRKNPHYAGCLRDGACTPAAGWQCQDLTKVVVKPSLVTPPTPQIRLFCFLVMIKDAGAVKKKVWDFDLVRTQLARQTGVFSCDSYRVFSDVATWLDKGEPGVRSGVFTVPVEAPHLAQRKNGAWVNSPIFLNVWQYIKENNLHKLCAAGCQGPNASPEAPIDWTVKVDPDTVFFADRLRARLSTQPITVNGVYITNCHFVDYGFFGNLEVLSQAAMNTLLTNMDTCKTELSWFVKGKEYGEDLYAQRCMLNHGVDNVEDFALSDDRVCKAIEAAIMAKTCTPDSCKLHPYLHLPECGDVSKVAYHPLKTPKDYFACLDTSIKESSKLAH